MDSSGEFWRVGDGTVSSTRLDAVRGCIWVAVFVYMYRQGYICPICSGMGSRDGEFTYLDVSNDRGVYQYPHFFVALVSCEE